MKTKNLKLVALIIVLVSYMKMGAQTEVTPKVDTYDYKNAIGIRAGETSGLTFKHKFNNRNATEVIVSVWPYTIGLTGLYEQIVPTQTNGLNWYFGAGAHINTGTMYRRYYFYNKGDRYVYAERRNTVALGLDGILGLEYKFKPVPFAISADIKPFIETSNYGYTFLSLDPSLGLKFTF